MQYLKYLKGHCHAIWQLYKKLEVIFQKQLRGFHQVSKCEKHLKPEARVFEITSPTKKISLNYHLNKFSQFNYYI